MYVIMSRSLCWRGEKDNQPLETIRRYNLGACD